MRDATRKDVITQSYEDLRDFIISHKMPLAPPRGLALLLRRGMPGWIEVWSRPVSSDQAVTIRPQRLGISPGGTGPLPLEAAAILTNMALAAIRRDNP
jgi:hypothetical protein